jgi:hypothetical protein
LLYRHVFRCIDRVHWECSSEEDCSKQQLRPRDALQLARRACYEATNEQTHESELANQQASPPAALKVAILGGLHARNA